MLDIVSNPLMKDVLYAWQIFRDTSNSMGRMPLLLGPITAQKCADRYRTAVRRAIIAITTPRRSKNYAYSLNFWKLVYDMSLHIIFFQHIASGITGGMR